MKKLIFLLFTGAGLAALINDTSFRVSSEAFEQNASLPARYTCQGQNAQPPLTLERIPEEARSIAIILTDEDAAPDAQPRWIAWNIPVTGQISENAIPGVQGKNAEGKLGYSAPCPGAGQHRYFFRVFVLDDYLDLAPGSSRSALENAMRDHIITSAELVANVGDVH